MAEWKSVGGMKQWKDEGVKEGWIKVGWRNRGMKMYGGIDG